MDLGISGKRALITGASMGLGFGVAEALAREGVHLVLFARNFEALNNAKVNLLQNHPGLDVQVISGDMTKAQDIRDLRQYLIDTG
jgi:3-oxoacyl-[acyl-carrier protein] reductase